MNAPTGIHYRRMPLEALLAGSAEKLFPRPDMAIAHVKWGAWAQNVWFSGEFWLSCPNQRGYPSLSIRSTIGPTPRNVSLE